MRYIITEKPSDVFFGGETYKANPKLRASYEKSVLSKKLVKGCHIYDQDAFIYFHSGVYNDHEKSEFIPALVNGYKQGCEKFDKDYDRNSKVFTQQQFTRYYERLLPQWKKKANLEFIIDTHNFHRVGFHSALIYNAECFLDRLSYASNNTSDNVSEIQTFENLFVDHASNNTSDNVSEIQTFEDLFVDPVECDGIKALLAEKGYLHPKTFLWVDFKKGYKKLLISIIKRLHALKYYKNNKMPTGNEIVSIAKNSFGVQLGIDTVKRANPEKEHIPFLSEIALQSKNHT